MTGRARKRGRPPGKASTSSSRPAQEAEKDVPSETAQSGNVETHVTETSSTRGVSSSQKASELGLGSADAKTSPDAGIKMPSLGGERGIPQPRNTQRRSKEEREAMERSAAEKMKAREKLAQASATSHAPSTRRRAIGANADRNARDSTLRLASSSNLQASAAATVAQSPRGVTSGGPARGRGGRKADGGGKGRGRGEQEVLIKVEDEMDICIGSARSPEHISSGASDEERSDDAKNIDNIHIVTDDDNEDSDSVPVKGQKHRTSYPIQRLRPIRPRRREHVDRQVRINTDASSTASASLRGQPQDMGAEFSDGADGIQSRPFKGCWSSSEDESLQKVDPKRKSVPAPALEEGIRPLPRFGPDFSRQLDEKVNKKALLKKYEAQRKLRNLSLATKELHPDDADLDVMDLDASKNNISQKNGLCLFQFPPVLPDLIDEQQQRQQEQQARAQSIPRDTQGNAINFNGASLPPNEPGNRRRAILNPGFVGKLRVHKSGRVTMDWGGLPMEVRPGVDSSVLQQIVAWRLPDGAAADAAMDNGKGKKKKEKKSKGNTLARVKTEELEEGGPTALAPAPVSPTAETFNGEAGALNGGKEEDREPGWAAFLGQVRDKFVVTPDWNELFAAEERQADREMGSGDLH